jgi:hypothetical protein
MHLRSNSLTLQTFEKTLEFNLLKTTINLTDARLIAFELRKKRQELGITIQQMSKLVNFSQQELVAIENADMNGFDRDLNKLAEALMMYSQYFDNPSSHQSSNNDYKLNSQIVSVSIPWFLRK